MKNKKISAYLSVILGILCLSLLGCNFYVFLTVQPKMANLQALGSGETLLMCVYLGILLAVVFHICAFVSMFLRFQISKKATFFGMATLCLGILSFLALGGDWAALNDIGKEYKYGLETSGEWLALYISQFCHLIFYILALITAFGLLRSNRLQVQTEHVFKDEVIFKVAQYIGVVCGALGLLFSLLAFFVYPVRMLKFVIPFFGVLIALPYGLVVFYWLLLKRKERIREWYDEKQFLDVCRASLFSLICTVPAMSLLFLFSYFEKSLRLGYLWFPFFLFLVLLSFSAAILYTSREN
ncbi:hypothetical protein JW935_22160 [candidate division KSB1 bacterium]|nr:hypothetical protein [candidate division KSB1 bacterium]